MLILVVGLAVFLGIHSVSIVAPRWRLAMIDRLGAGPWKALYAIVSVVGFVVLVVGYGIARREPVVLYTPPAGLRHLTLLLMVPVFTLFIAPYFPGRISRVTKHPQLLSVKIWATAHLIANGTLADVVLFGAFLVWAVADRISAKRRPAIEAHQLPGAPPSAMNDVIAVVAGLVVYVVFLFWAHRLLIGVSPLG
ncbi:MAG: NnrU family protein [Caldimonas sp.]